MRTALYLGALLALAMLFSPDVLRSALAISASALVEATPFLFAGVVAARVLRLPQATSYLGCGCAAGPSARSLPAAAVTWLVFGPLVAASRFAAALIVARLLQAKRRAGGCAEEPAHLLGELAVLLPAALLAGACVQLLGAFDPGRLPPMASAGGGALLGFAAAPCGIGAIAVAGALASRAPIGAGAFLCVAGIVDLRALARRTRVTSDHDALAYALLAAALGIVAIRRGDALVHPALAPALAASSAAALFLAIRHRRRQSPATRLAPVLMLAGALIAAPPPQYHATETTLADLFAGEHLTFTGRLVRRAGVSALVRYAITCCRADAAPIVVRLDRPLSLAAGSWLRADGRIAGDGELRLVARKIEAIAPPDDPFIYR